MNFTSHKGWEGFMMDFYTLGIFLSKSASKHNSRTLNFEMIISDKLLETYTRTDQCAVYHIFYTLVLS